MAAKRPYLNKLANKLGIIPSYIDYSGVRRFASDATRVALIEAMGWKAGTEKESVNSIHRIEVEERERVHHYGFLSESGNHQQIELPLPRPTKRPIQYEVSLSHYTHEPPKKLTGLINKPIAGRAISIRLPAPLRPGGNHAKIELQLDGKVFDRTFYALVTPDRCWLPRILTGNQSCFGICTNLYTLRRKHNWGVGDLTDLQQLVEWTAKQGGDFIGLNPLHYVPNLRNKISPYSPSSRLFRNPIYIDVERVPEFRSSAEARRIFRSETFQRSLMKLRASDSIAYEEVLSPKMEILRLLYQDFRTKHINPGRRTPRWKAYARYCYSHAVHGFAVYCALEKHFRETAGYTSWHQWPAGFRHRSSNDVTSFAKANDVDVEFYKYVQFELDRQLQEIESRSREQGLRLGLYLDFAVGSAADGFDAWEWGSNFVTGVEVGCPPDAHSSTGQNWSFSPLNPWYLDAHAFAFWDWLVQWSMRRAGMLRIDHVMGLTRQFWIPNGRSPSDGAYVKFPFEQLCRELAYHSHNYQTVVVGEDLGTVPKGFSDTLKKWGILSTRLMMFERTKRGQFRKPSEYREFAVTSATNHDLPPLKGFIESTDLELRKKIGLFKSKAAWEKAKKDRAADVRALIRRLVAERLLDKRYLIREPRTSAREVSRKNASSASSGVPYQVILEAVHRFLGRTPSKVVAVMLDDLLGETEPINLPGVGPDKHASWSRKMTRTLEDALADPAVARAFQAVRAGKRRVASRKGAKPQKKKR